MQTKAEKRRTVLRLMAHQRRYGTSLTLDADLLETTAKAGTDAEVLDLVRLAEQTRRRAA